VIPRETLPTKRPISQQEQINWCREQATTKEATKRTGDKEIVKTADLTISRRKPPTSGMVHLVALILIAALLLAVYACTSRSRPASIDSILSKEGEVVPVSVNYFFTRHCNAECGFCFHTETSSYKLPLPKAEKGLRLLAEAGMKKVNFAGGEPFLYPKYLGALCRYCKEDLRLESVSIVSNGTKVTEKWLQEYGPYVDIVAISCDSINPATNAAIGRADRGSGVPFDNVGKLFQTKEWCQQYGIRFKLNTVSILRVEFPFDTASSVVEGIQCSRHLRAFSYPPSSAYT
jgi:sulfatase maturation enzyme AslB (radical SAM superfamily)